MNFDTIINRKNTMCIKHDFIKKAFPLANENTLPLWVADMDFPCSEAIINTLRDRINHGIYGYSSVNSQEYYDSIISWYKTKHDYIVKKEDIFYSPGIVPAIGILINILTEEEDAIIINQPVYSPFINLIKNNNRKLINSPLIQDEKGDFNINLKDLEKKIKDNNVKMYILCSPHNPTGGIFTKEELLEIGRICIENDVILLSDEIHCDIVRKGEKHIPIASLFEEHDNFITATAPSKTFNIAGLKLSNIIIKSEEHKEKWKNFIDVKLHTNEPNILVHDTMIAAYTKSEDWYEYMLEYVENNMIYIKNYIDENLPKVKFNIPKASFLCWLDLREYNVDYKELCDIFVVKGNVAIQEGSMFGKEGYGFFRLNAGCSIEIIKEALENIKRTLEDI